MLELAGLIKAAALALAFRPPATLHAERDTFAPAGTAAVPAEVIDLAERRSPSIADTPPLKLPPSAPRKPAAAARRFLAWLESEGYAEPGQELYWANGPTYPLRDPNRPGTEVGIWQLYAWHCKDENTIAIPETRFAEALGRLCEKRLVRDRTSGKLRRLTVYRVPDCAKPAGQLSRRAA